MTKNKKHKLILFATLALCILGLSTLYTPTSKERVATKLTASPAVSSPTPGVGQIPEKESSPPKSPAATVPTATLLVNSQRLEGELEGPTNVYLFMEKLKSEGKINYTDRTYMGMGKIITSINGIRSNGDMTWIYYVNGTEAEVGVSKYIINPGDVVSWKYEKLKY